MAERSEAHSEVAGYLLGALDPEDRVRFERHLETCEGCREAVAELRPVAELLPRAAPDYALPAGLMERTLAAVERAAAEGRLAAPEGAPRAGEDLAADRGLASPELLPDRDSAPPRRARPRRPMLRRFGLAALGVAAAVAALLVGARIGADRVPGSPELSAVLTAPDGPPRRATAQVNELGIGRRIAFRTDDLPILPKKNYYELWFVGPGDSRQKPNRISAGTFHPDEDGRSDVTFTAAVNPKLYPTLAVTREPGDGNPLPTGPEVLRSERASPGGSP